jgi:hypothetical protein
MVRGRPLGDGRARGLGDDVKPCAQRLRDAVGRVHQYRPARVLVAGTSGSGKSTLAHHLAATLELRYVELDALHHGANWAPQPAFVEDVTRFATEPRWATEWQYPAVRERLAQRADLLIFLDLSRPVVMTRVIRCVERHPTLPVVRLRTPGQIEDWLAGPLRHVALRR